MHVLWINVAYLLCSIAGTYNPQVLKLRAAAAQPSSMMIVGFGKYARVLGRRLIQIRKNCLLKYLKGFSFKIFLNSLPGIRLLFNFLRLKFY